MNSHVVFIGAPGSGKGTQSRFLVDNYGYEHLSTGDFLRAEIKKESELGKKVANIIENGQLVDDHTITEIIKANVDLDARKYVFDGFPRTVAQADSFVSLVADRPFKAVYFDISLEVLIERVVNRRVCQSCNSIYNLKTNPSKKEGICDKCGGSVIQRKDDTEETVRKRMAVFNESTSPLLSFFDKKDALCRIDATLGLDEIRKKLQETLN